jgi:hypothetical protein
MFCGPRKQTSNLTIEAVVRQVAWGDGWCEDFAPAYGLNRDRTEVMIAARKS